MSEQQQIDEHVRNLYTAENLSVTPEELSKFTRRYAGVRHAVQALYTLPGVRYENPAPTFSCK